MEPSPVGSPTPLTNGQSESQRESYSDRPFSPRVKEGVSGANEYQSTYPEYQRSVDYQNTQPPLDYHTAQQDYQTIPEYQTVQPVQPEYQSVKPEYQPLPLQPPPPPRSPAYGSPTHRGGTLRRTDSRTFVPAPAQQRPSSPLNFQPQNYQRPPPNSYRPNPPPQTQQYRPQLQRREDQPSNQDIQRSYSNQQDNPQSGFNPVPRDPQTQKIQPQSPQSPQGPPIPRQPGQGLVRRPNPWSVLKQKLPADVRQQFVPIRHPQFDGRQMQNPEQGPPTQRPLGDGQPMNPGIGRGGNPNQGMQSPSPGSQNPNRPMQSPNGNPMYNGRPPSGNPPQKPGMPMQRPMSQEGRDSPSSQPMQGMQRVMSGERRSPLEMQRNDSMRSMDPRSMNSPPQGMYSPSGPRPMGQMGDRGRETPPGPPRTPKYPGNDDDDNDVVYSPANDLRNEGMFRGQTPPIRPQSSPRPGPIPPDINRDMNSPRPGSIPPDINRDMNSPRPGSIPPDINRDMSSSRPGSIPPDINRDMNSPRPGSIPPDINRDMSSSRPGSMSSDMNRDINTSRPLSRTESRQGFEVRSPTAMDTRGEPKQVPRESSQSRPLSSELARTPFQYRPEGQNTPPASPKPDYQSNRSLSISPQESLDRQRMESRGPTPQNMSPRPPMESRPSTRTDEIKYDPGFKGSISRPGSRDTTSYVPSELSKQENRVESPILGYDKPPSVIGGSLTPSLKSNDVSRSPTPNSFGLRDTQSASKSPDISHTLSPTPTKVGSDSGNATPVLDKDSLVSESNTREVTPVKTPDRSETPDMGKRNVDRPSSLKRPPSSKQEIANSPDHEGRRSPLVRTPSRTSSAGKGNDITSPLQRTSSGRRSRTPRTPDGDHDSGVDENTQRKDIPTTNGDLGSPSKSPSKIPAPKKLSMPSPTKSNKSSPKTPEAPPTAEKKKVPMNKVQVGAAPSPNLKTVKSKIGSLQNSTHKPGGGNVKIENRKLDWKAQPRIAAKNDTYQPGGGDKKITQVKLQWNAKPKVGSLDNATHKPGGGEKKIESVKLDFKDKAKPKVGSKDNIKHTPGGGNVKTLSLDGSQNGHAGEIENQKIDLKAQSKIGSLDNVKHKPGGGDKKIFDDKDYLKQMSGTTSKAGSEGIPSGTQGEDGWSSANTSRRTSRDRRRSHDRRYRSESCLGIRTPEPKISPKEEHCSLKEKYLQEQEILQEANEHKISDADNQEIKQQEIVTPLRPTSSASEQTLTRDSSEDKDLNSNQTNSSQSDGPDNKKGGECIKQKTFIASPSNQLPEHSKVLPKNEIRNELEQSSVNSKNVNEPTKATSNTPLSVEYDRKCDNQEEIPTNFHAKNEIKTYESQILIPSSNVTDPKPEQLQPNVDANKEITIIESRPMTSPINGNNPEQTLEKAVVNNDITVGNTNSALHSSKETAIKKPENIVTNVDAKSIENGQMPLSSKESVSRPEPKENIVEEIKEIDSKELSIQTNQQHQFDVNIVNTFNVTSDQKGNSRDNGDSGSK